MLDVFNSRLFETTTLTAAINELPLVPQVIGELGLFEEGGVPTTSVVVEKVGQSLSIVPVTERGAPGTPIQGDKRKGLSFVIPRLAVTAQLQADEVQNVREFGSNDQMAGVETERDKKLLKMSRSLDLTHEYHRLGAINGVVLDADGTTVIYDLYDEFGISAPAEEDMNLDAAWTEAGGGIIRKKIRGIVRDVQADLGGNTMTGAVAFCGDDFFDAITDHPETRQTFMNQQEANQLRNEDKPVQALRYGGVLFVNYIGTGAVAIPATKARLVPLGVPELFITRFGPADYMEAVNTNGLPKYTKAVPDPSGFNRSVHMESQSNPLHICTRPQVLRTLKLT